jgi:hypothetical protein
LETFLQTSWPKLQNSFLSQSKLERLLTISTWAPALTERFNQAEKMFDSDKRSSLFCQSITPMKNNVL